MVLASAGYTLVMDYLSYRHDAETKAKEGYKRLTDEFNRLSAADQQVGTGLFQDPAFAAAYTTQNRAALGQAVKAFLSKSGFSGFVVVLNERGDVFYSSETPSKFGDSMRSQSPGVDYVLMRNAVWQGASALSPVGTLAVTAMVPISNGPNAIGVIAVCEPL